jgi:hypothetical protein
MRRRVSMWQWGWTLGIALLCVYIAFDVLDLDGSQLQTRFGAAITTAVTSAEADRIVRASASPALIRLCLPASRVDTGLRLYPDGIRYRSPQSCCLLPRRHLSHLDSRTSAQSPDPA